jgi:hypothetical protein
MNPISTAEMAQIRADAYKGTFDSICQIWRNQKSFDSKGGSPDDFILIEDDVPCALKDLTVPQQQQLAQQDVGLNAKMLLTPFGTDGIADDQVVKNGVTYKLLAPYGDSVYQVFETFVVLKKSLP